MSDKIYFQWQKEILRETIYPVRDMKLRHFLLYYYEIDLWAQYKDKQDWSIDKFPKEKKEFLDAQKKALTDAYIAELSLKSYFKEELSEVVVKPWNEGNESIARLNKLLKNIRTDFAAFFKVSDEEGNSATAGQPVDRGQAPAIEMKSGQALMGDLDAQRSRDRKEKIHVAMYVSDWESHLKDLKRILARKKNLADYTDPNFPSYKRLVSERDILSDLVIPRLQDELNNLKVLVAAQNKLEKRKAEFSKRVATHINDRDIVLKELLPKRKAVQKWESKRQELGRELVRVTKNTDLDGVLQELSKNDIYGYIRTYLEAADTHVEVIKRVIGHVQEALEDQASNFYSVFLAQIAQWRDKNKAKAKADPSWIVQWVKDQAARFLGGRKKLDKIITILESKIKSKRIELAKTEDNQKQAALSGEIGTIQQVIGILQDSKLRNAFDEQWDKFDELQHALRVAFPIKGAAPDRNAADVKLDLHNVLKKFLDAKADSAGLELRLEQINDALSIKREKYLKEFILDRPLTLKEDILPFLAEQYYASLMEFDHDELLFKVYQRFWAEPERFPLWLQYMVIHFSGMRYASAHGSWADPRDLLLNLRTKDIHEQIEKEKTDLKMNGLLEAVCQARYAIYEPLKAPIDAARTASLPEDARAAAQNYRFIKRFQEYYKGQLSSPVESKRSTAYVELRVDEEGCEIQAMKNEDVLEQLKYLHQELHFPDWMWKEIVKLTDLRLTEVEDKNWETLSPAEQEERLMAKDKKLAQYREIINKWKSDNLTGWREEHERTNRLIVTRAVCNEIAEHIQHLRGHVSAAGLTQKPLWYKGAEDDYFKAKKKQQNVSESTDDKPEPRPYFVRAKDRGDDHHTFEVGASILWLRFVNDSPNQWRIAEAMTTREGDDLVDKKYRGRKPESGNWTYIMGTPISRSRQKLDAKRKPVGPKETQYLRWLHEATVATVADTAEGKVVLTFETTLPSEDPSVSTVGVLKRYVKDLNSDLGEDAYNAAFVGFMPEKTLSTDDVTSMEEMLDWNHIFLREVVTPAQLEEYREKYVRNHKSPAPLVHLIDPLEERRGPRPVIGSYDKNRYLDWTKEIAQPGTNMYRVRRWGDRLLRGGELSVEAARTTNFQAIGLYNKGTKTFGAVKNFISILRPDIDNLKAMQVEDQYEGKKPDWRRQKMNWLCQYEGSIYMFENEHDSWTRSKKIRWGTLALGGNLVQVEGAFEYIDIKVSDFVVPPPEEEIDPNNPSVIQLGNGKFRLRMARLRGFGKWDWGRPLDDLLKEGLVHRCFCAGGINDIKDSPQGVVYSPFFGLQHWDFCGTTQPKHLYIPLVYLEKQVATPPSI